MKFLKKMIGGSPEDQVNGGAGDETIRPFDEVTAVQAHLARNQSEAPEEELSDWGSSEERERARAEIKAEAEAARKAAEAARNRNKAEPEDEDAGPVGDNGDAAKKEAFANAADVMAVVNNALQDETPAAPEPQAAPVQAAPKPKPMPEPEVLPAGTKPSIWDIEEGGDDEDSTQVAFVKRAAGRKRRMNARMMGYENDRGDMTDDEEFSADGRVMFPVGFILVVKGRGRGAFFPLESGLSTIGRGSDQTVALTFGDKTISRQNHAAIIYDPQDRTFLLSSGGKTNVVRMNGQPVISTTPIRDGDLVSLGNTVLRLAKLCSPTFGWEDLEDEDGNDVAIA